METRSLSASINPSSFLRSGPAPGRIFSDLFVRAGDDVDADQLAHAAGGGGARIGGGFDRADIAAHRDGDVARADKFLAGEHHVGRL